MKKNIICLMIACLSLFAVPYQLNAGALATPKDKTELPIIPPAMEKKVNEFKKNHPGMFTKKNNKEENNAEENATQGGRHGGVYYISGGALLLIIILLIILL
jgi:hypothetical protein